MSDITIRELMRNRREQLGLTQREVGRLGGPHSSTIAAMESGSSGSHNYTVGVLARWAEALDMEAGMYFVADGHMTTIRLTKEPDDDSPGEQA